MRKLLLTMVLLLPLLTLEMRADNEKTVIKIPVELEKNATWYTPMESWRVMIDLGNGLEEVSFSNKKRMICNFQ